MAETPLFKAAREAARRVEPGPATPDAPLSDALANRPAKRVYHMDFKPDF